jgi:hypothetical protein
MKRVLVVGLIIAGLSVAGFAIPVLAHGSGGGGTANHEAWDAMHEACETGDWEAMAEAAEEVHGGEMGSHMSGGMMGDHMGGGMMGWR